MMGVALHGIAYRCAHCTLYQVTWPCAALRCAAPRNKRIALIIRRSLHACLGFLVGDVSSRNCCPAVCCVGRLVIRRLNMVDRPPIWDLSKAGFAPSSSMTRTRRRVNLYARLCVPLLCGSWTLARVRCNISKYIFCCSKDPHDLTQTRRPGTSASDCLHAVSCSASCRCCVLGKRQDTERYRMGKVLEPENPFEEPIRQAGKFFSTWRRDVPRDLQNLGIDVRRLWGKRPKARQAGIDHVSTAFRGKLRPKVLALQKPVCKAASSA
jgi:hypothetical protein